MCPQCGTRDDEWDHGRDGEEDAYVARTHLCVGCQVIAETQEQAQKDGLGHGIKVHLVPVQVAAALDLQRDLKSGKRTTNE